KWNIEIQPLRPGVEAVSPKLGIKRRQYQQYHRYHHQMHRMNFKHSFIQLECFGIDLRTGKTYRDHHQNSKYKRPSHIDEEGNFITSFTIRICGVQYIFST